VALLGGSIRAGIGVSVSVRSAGEQRSIWVSGTLFIMIWRKVLGFGQPPPLDGATIMAFFVSVMGGIA